jgi:hypothetical protein
LTSEQYAAQVGVLARHLEYISSLDGRRVNLYVDVHSTGTNAPGGGFVDPGTGSTYPGSGKQHGANFVVPPGYPNDSYPMRVQSGEHVTVTPRQGNTYNQTWNVYTNGGQQPYEKDYNLRRALAPR